MRYRLSWLLALPIFLALVVWWLKPPAHASYAYLANPKRNFPADHESVYLVKPAYLSNQLLLAELKECDYAVIFMGASWSIEDVMTRNNLLSASKPYCGRVPIFLCMVDDLNIPDEWFGDNTRHGLKSLGIVAIVKRGEIIFQDFGFYEQSSIQKFATLLKNNLPWNYSL